MRARAEPSPLVRRLLVTMIASEVERVRAPDLASETAAADFLRIALSRDPPAREDLLARARELSLDLQDGASVIVARAHPQAPADEGWRSRVRAVAERGARAVAGRSIAALSEREGAPGVEILLLVPGGEEPLAGRAAEAVLREMESALTATRSRLDAAASPMTPPTCHAPRARRCSRRTSSRAAPGAVTRVRADRRLPPTALRDEREPERAAELLRGDRRAARGLRRAVRDRPLQTLETFLEADGNVAGTAQRLFTHRHTVYYRLERVRELTGLDVSSSDGREKLSLGLKAMRVLGISSARGPASEDGARGGRVPRRPSRRP